MEIKEEATISLLNHNTNDEVATHDQNNIPKDSYNLAYIIYFILGTGFMLPWNAFITSVDYFDYLYPDCSIDRIFAVVYQSVSLLCILLLFVFCFRTEHDCVGALGRSGFGDGFYVIVGALGICGIVNALVQGGVIGSAAELPKRYLQAAVAGTSASGAIVSFIKIFTKAVYQQDSNHGLRNSAILYYYKKGKENS